MAKANEDVIVLMTDNSRTTDDKWPQWGPGVNGHQVKIREIGSDKKIRAWLEKHPKKRSEVLAGRVVPSEREGSYALVLTEHHLVGNAHGVLVVGADNKKATYLAPYTL